MASEKILVVEDERHNLLVLERILALQGYEISAFSNGEDVLAFPSPEIFEVAILDLNLGRGLSGMDVLAHLRQNAPDTMIILLTGNGTLETAVEALRQGAHDYLIKPAKSKEIQASIEKGLKKRQKQLTQRKREAVLSQLEKNLEESLNKLRETDVETVGTSNGEKKLTEGHGEGGTKSGKTVRVELESDARFLTWKEIRVDLLRRQISVDGHALDLSPTEYDLFLYLIKEAPRIVSPMELVRQIQGYDADQDEASGVIRTHIYRLRQKIKAVLPERNIIQTARGVGYAVES